MAVSRSNDWGWFFLRMAAGLIFFGLGLKDWEAGGTGFKTVAQLVAGVTAMLGLFVRPGALVVLLATAWLTVSSRGVGVRLFFDALAPLLFALGLLIGGGGTVLSAGYMVAGLRGKWWQ
jgi:hypothetical protein